ncbi:MAG: isochorismatase family protein [Gammaproteobacteria bacterium]
MKSALIVVDVQQSFQQRPYWHDEDVAPFMSQIQKLIDRCQSQGVPVLQVFHEEPSGVFSRASGHVKALEALRIAPTEVFYKNVHSALFGRASNGKSLETWLRDNGIQHVIVTGIRTEQCCETTTRHASDSGFEVTYAMDATLTFPMVAKSGRTYSAADIMERTELVLADRFAKVVNAEAVAL